MSKVLDPKDFPFLRVAACSYEGSIFGWKVEENAEQMEMTSKLTFGFNASIGALKAIACSLSGKYLVVGGMDERIRIYDMHDNKAVGELSQHTGAVTSLKFFNDSYLISASEDFNLCIWRVYDWQCVHILGGHKDTIHDFSIHPTGKMALSVSKDGTLKLWNLVQGRCAFTRRLKGPTEQVIWHEETGEYYMLVTTRDIQLYKAADNSCLATHTHGSRINRACFTSVIGKDGTAQWRMVTVCDNKTVNMFDFEGNQTACVDLSPLGSTRPRDIYSVAPNTASVSDPDMKEVLQHELCCLVLATSTGQVVVLSANNVEKLGMAGADTSARAGGDKGAEELTVGSCVLSSHQIKAEPRLTALVAWNPAAAAALYAAKGNKRPRSILDCDVRSDGDNEGDEESLNSAPKSKAGKKAKTDKVAVSDKSTEKVAVKTVEKSAEKSVVKAGEDKSSERKVSRKVPANDAPALQRNDDNVKPVATKNNKTEQPPVVANTVKNSDKSAEKKDTSVAKKVKTAPASPAAEAPQQSKKAKFTKAAAPKSPASEPEEAEHDANKVVSFYSEERKPKGNDKFKKGKGNKNKGKGPK